MESCISKSYDQILKALMAKHLSPANPEHELKRIHNKWKWIASTTR